LNLGHVVTERTPPLLDDEITPRRTPGSSLPNVVPVESETSTQGTSGSPLALF
jgi:hypothetical protein